MIAVAGCVAQAEGQEIIRRAPAVDVVVGPQSYHHLPQLLARAERTGSHIGALSHALYRLQGEPAIRRIQGLLSFAKKYGVARVDDACAVALEVEAYDFRFVRRYLERNSQPPLSLRQVDPLIRQLHLYRDLIQERTKEPNP